MPRWNKSELVFDGRIVDSVHGGLEDARLLSA